MNLHKGGREWYVIDIATTPAVEDAEAWELSVDGGTTWKTGEATTVDVAGDDVAALRWLIAGPTFVPEDGDVETPVELTDTATVRPLVRLVDNPEVIIEDAPRIYIRR